jgi:hypothetical protein
MATSRDLRDAFRPIEVFTLALQRPARRGARNDVGQIRNLVRELDELSTLRDVGGMQDLQLLALLLGQALVVAHLLYDAGDLRAERRGQFRGGGFGILQRVMQECRRQHVGASDLTFATQDLRESERVVDVGRGRLIFAALVAMFPRGKLGRFEYQRNASRRHVYSPP